ncbi:hypothetical protein FRC03_007563 [Tulasnella sp. 419]|nr:hypothetical protein FRC03_007563 [Tulasnella sp. 419]
MSSRSSNIPSTPNDHLWNQPIVRRPGTEGLASIHRHFAELRARCRSLFKNRSTRPENLGRVDYSPVIRVPPPGPATLPNPPPPIDTPPSPSPSQSRLPPVIRAQRARNQTRSHPSTTANHTLMNNINEEMHPQPNVTIAADFIEDLPPRYTPPPDY